MIAAGPLVELFAGLVALWIALAVSKGLQETIWQILALVSAFSLVGFVVNLIPLRPESTYSDGAQIYQLLRGGPWADLHRAVHVAESTLVTPLRPRNCDIETISRAAGYFTRGIQGVKLRLFASSHFLDNGEIQQAREAFNEAKSVYMESTPEIPIELQTDFVFGSAFLCHDAADTRLWWERMNAKKATYFGVDYWLARSAFLWTGGSAKDAREAWEKGSLLAQKLPATGSCEFNRYRYNLLREALDAALLAEAADMLASTPPALNAP
jgi:hypothetical protein